MINGVARGCPGCGAMPVIYLLDGLSVGQVTVSIACATCPAAWTSGLVTVAIDDQGEGPARNAAIQQALVHWNARTEKKPPLYRADHLPLEES